MPTRWTRALWSAAALILLLSGCGPDSSPTGDKAADKAAGSGAGDCIPEAIDGTEGNGTSVRTALPEGCDPATPTTAAAWPKGKGTLVAFGDSFSAGEGAPEVLSEDAGPYIDGRRIWTMKKHYLDGTDTKTNRCHRSARAYPFVLAQELGMNLDFRACSGATTADYWGSQKNRYVPGDDKKLIDAQRLAPLPPDTALVTVGFGGNNVGFADIVAGCLTKQDRSCEAKAQDGIDHLRENVRIDPAENMEYNRPDWATYYGTDPRLTRSLEGTYSNIRAITPTGVPVIAVTYPRMFPAEPDSNTDCGFGAGGAILEPAEQRKINELVDLLNQEIIQAATAARIDAVDMTTRYATHGLCEDAGPDGNGANDTEAGNHERWVNRFHLGAMVPDFTWHYKELIAKLLPETQESAHPNGAGQLDYYRAVRACYDPAHTCAHHVEDGVPLTGVDWRALAFPLAGCIPREEWIAEGDGPAEDWDTTQPEVSTADVTGDGRPETITKTNCPHSTSSWPEVFTVWDTRSTTPHPLLTVGATDLYFRGAEAQPGDGKVTFVGPTIGEDDGLCCPGHWTRLEYTYKDGVFTETENLTMVNEADTQTGVYPPVDVVHEGLPDGLSYGILRAARANEVVVDVVEVFKGESAAQECAKDGEPVGDDVWCNGIYIRNGSLKLRAVRVPDGAHVQWWADYGLQATTQVTAAELGKLEAAGKTGMDGPYFAIESSGGDITSIEEEQLLP
jgi:hypothetical protein